MGRARIATAGMFVILVVTSGAAIVGAADRHTSVPRDGVVIHRADATAKYVGTKKCRMCHGDHYRSWLSSPHGPLGGERGSAVPGRTVAPHGAWNLLKPGVDAEAKRRAGLGVEVDYTTDGRCLTCHAVGFGQRGGYAVPGEGDNRSERRANARQGVGCEMCHGPGGDYTVVMSDIKRERRMYEVDELHAAGLNSGTVAVCASCHQADAPCLGSDQRHTLDVGDRLQFHDKFPLEFRSPPPAKLVHDRSLRAAP